MKKGVSIVIPTYNGASTIGECLTHISRQHTSSCFSVEVILVDNNSTDETARIARDTWIELSVAIPLIIVLEKQQGLSHARRCGVVHAQYEVIIFCDDDNLLAPDYCTHVLNFFETHPEYGLVGGEVLPDPSLQLPGWFNRVHGMYAISYINVPFADKTNSTIVGAGMSIRTAVARIVFDNETPIICIGPSGNNEFRCDDGEVCRRVDVMGYKIGQLKEMTLWHRIQPERLNPAYLERLRKQGARDYFILTKYNRAKAVSKMKLTERITNGLFSFFKLMLYPVARKRLLKEHNMDYLYFITGWDLFSDSYSKTIRDFYKMVSNTIKE